jgi:hypothetical protein
VETSVRLAALRSLGLVLRKKESDGAPAPQTTGPAELCVHFVMAGHSRSKNGVASLAYVPAIPIGDATRCLPKRDARDKRGHDEGWRSGLFENRIRAFLAAR